MPDVIDYSDDEEGIKERSNLKEIAELERLILGWEKSWHIDIDSGTIPDNFWVFLSQLPKTDIHKKALETVFERCMRLRLHVGLQKWFIKSLPHDVMRVLSGDEIVNTSESDIFVGNYIIQMKHYYALFLEWQKS